MLRRITIDIEPEREDSKGRVHYGLSVKSQDGNETFEDLLAGQLNKVIKRVVKDALESF